MGGHADGERAAEIAQRTIVERFRHTPQPLLDPLGFLHAVAGRGARARGHAGRAAADRAAAALRPARCAWCSRPRAYWAHVGDSRIYHVRAGSVLERTRDHSHVELLVREGVISAGQVPSHPMRNFVESCLGGDPILPEMALCAPAAWCGPAMYCWCAPTASGSASSDAQIGSAFVTLGVPLHDTLAGLAAQALVHAGGASDNTSVAALRLLD